LTADPSEEHEIVDALDWVLPTFDSELMEPQTLDEEVKRLQVLKCYMVLDQEREEAFDRITQLASRVFNVPVAVINLIDLGRLWLLSTNGLGDIRECPRKVTFCACKLLEVNMTGFCLWCSFEIIVDLTRGSIICT